jgi:hypothetical protein
MTGDRHGHLGMVASIRGHPHSGLVLHRGMLEVCCVQMIENVTVDTVATDDVEILMMNVDETYVTATLTDDEISTFVTLTFWSVNDVTETDCLIFSALLQVQHQLMAGPHSPCALLLLFHGY